ncbi:Cys-Gly metallodipeptidase dug1 [Hondaea fermentalgiana]|uniref:Cys-Gly metallodipeptidase dug1 n=1 Tax=Hondaea fermentalgiana TaxID=2315210 RepID=A0A2R5FZ76_9STRA|nr:Cys-Gly metallodipeptidase dug1 [Hondaea fermentalgiana]|eukprot:GBG24052.1 Cys-Gly metallodipeptidase dug1 [Hondaea fermentalgiana]
MHTSLDRMAFSIARATYSSNPRGVAASWLSWTTGFVSTCVAPANEPKRIILCHSTKVISVNGHKHCAGVKSMHRFVCCGNNERVLQVVPLQAQSDPTTYELYIDAVMIASNDSDFTFFWRTSACLWDGVSGTFGVVFTRLALVFVNLLRVRFRSEGNRSALSIADLVTRPERSVIRQSFDARERLGGDGGEVYDIGALNADGFGLGWYTENMPDGLSPCVFTDVGPAWNNRNLVNLARKTSSPLIFAHVRAAGPGMGICTCSCHPFEFGRFLFMHNGQVSGFGGNVRRSLLSGLKLEAFNFAIHNSCSDSAVAFAVFIDMLDDPYEDVSPSKLQHLLQETIRRLCAACDREPTGGVSLLNFVVSDGRSMVATRYVHVHPSADNSVHESARAASLYFASGSRFEPEGASDQGQESAGEETGGSCGGGGGASELRRYRMARTDVRDELVIVTSEPLTERRADWISIPTNHLLLVSPSKNLLLSPIINDPSTATLDHKENALLFDRTLERLQLSSRVRGARSLSESRRSSLRNVDCNVVTTTSPTSLSGIGSPPFTGRSTSTCDESFDELGLENGAIPYIGSNDEPSHLLGDAPSSPFPEHSMTGAHSSALLSMAVYKHYVISADSSTPGVLCVWDLSLWKRVCEIEKDAGVFALCVDHVAAQVYASCSDNAIVAWDLVEGAGGSVKLEEAFRIHFPPIGHILSLASDPDAKTLFAGSQDSCIRCVDLSAAQHSPRGTSFVLAAESPKNCVSGIWKYSLVEGEAKADERASEIFVGSHLSYVHRILVCQNVVASGSGDGIIKLWGRKDLRAVATLSGHRGRVMSLAEDVGSKSLFSASLDGTIRVWDLDSYACRRVLLCGSPVLSITVARDARSMLISSHTDEVLCVWDLRTMQVTDSFSNRSGLVFCMGVPSVDHAAASWTSGVGKRVKSLVACATSSGAVVSFNLRKIQKTAPRSGSGSWRGSMSTSIEQRFMAVEKSFSEALSPDDHGEIDFDDALIETLRELVRIRTVSAKPEFYEECFFGAKALARLCEKLGCAEVKICFDESERSDESVPMLPAVLATLKANTEDEDAPTLIIYGHYDVVSAVRSAWATDPWEMTGQDGYLYGRGVTDDKGPLLACLFAAKAAHAAGNLRCNVTFVIEGQEESGLGLEQRGFSRLLQNNASFFNRPCGVLISNNYWLDDKRPCLTYGMRGVIDLEVEVQGPTKDLHAGVHGGPIYEPAADLMATLAAVTCANVPELREGVRALEQSEIENFQRINLSMTRYASEVGAPQLRLDDPTRVLAARWCEPSLSISSLSTSNAGQHFRRIPKSCVARLSVHFVPDQTAETLVAALRAHLETVFASRGSANTLQVTVRQTSDWWLGDTSNRLFKVAEAAIQSTWGVRPLYVREGGSYGGISAFLEHALAAPVLHLPMGQATDNAHLPNERISVENLLQGKRVQLELTQQLKSAHDSSNTDPQFYYLDKFSKFRVPGVGATVNWLPSVEAVDCCPIPRAIRTLYSQIECEMFMGLFHEINRAWITIDNRLFLWNYYKEDDFYVYDGVDQLIVSVGLARPRPGIFDADVEYIVAISTPVEVLLLQLKIVGHPVYGDIILEPTEYNMATDNVPMRSIAGTADGRIFMAGHDGSLYEFVYEAPGVLHSLGLKRQCRKVELSSAGSWLVPSFLKNLTGSPDPLVKVLVDHERDLLYTLSDRSTVSLYRLSPRKQGAGSDGNSSGGITAVVGSKDLTPLVRNFVNNQRIGRSGVRKADLAESLRIVSLNIVRKQESDSIHLVAITHLGVRIFLTTRKGDKNGIDFFVDHVRGPPNKEQQKSASQGANQGLGPGNALSTSLLAQRHLPHARSSMEALQEGISPGPETSSVVGAAVYADGVTLLANVGEGKSLPDLVSGGGANGNSATSNTNGHRNAEYTLSAFSADLGMRQNATPGAATSPKGPHQQQVRQQQGGQNPVPAAFPPLHWQQEAYHEIIDLDILEQGPSPRPSASDIAARRSARSLPAGRVWDMCEATFDPTVSEDEELVYGHMIYAPDPVPVRKESASKNSGSARSTGPASKGGSTATSTLSGAKRKSPEDPSTPSLPNGWVTSATSSQMRSKVLSLSELAKQHVMPRRYFLVLTSHGLWVLVKNRPINQLYALLRGPDPGSNADIEEFFKQYGLDESCSMCLAIACKAGYPDDADETSNRGAANDDPSPFADSGASDEATQNQWVARRAALWFRRIGYGIANLSPDASFPTHHQSLPCFTQTTGGQRGSRAPSGVNGAGGMTSLVPSAPRAAEEMGGLEHSGCYSGICLHATRLLRPIWEWSVTVGAEQMFKETADAPVVRCRFSPDQLVMLVRPLARLKQFLSTQAPFSDAIREYQHAQNSAGGTMNFDQQVSAWVSSGRIGLPRGPSAQSLENIEIAQIYQLVDRTIQGLLLMDILQTLPSMRFARLVLYLDGDLRSELASMTWSRLVTSKQGKIVACAMVKTLVERSPRAAARELVARLERFCPAFFSEGDALQISAFEKIAAAEEATLAQERNEHIQEALDRLRRGFRKIVSSSGAANIEVTQTTLRDACEKFESFGRPDAAVELALYCADCFAGQGVDTLPSPESGSMSGSFMAVREFCYDRAVQILARCLPKGAASVSLATLQDGAAKNSGDPMQTALQLALDAKDALWHYTLYDWFLGKGFRQLLLDVRTPFIVQFLGDAVANDPRKAGPGIYEPPFHRDMHLLLQVEWLARHEEFARAAEVVQSLAKLDVRQLLTDGGSSESASANGGQHLAQAAEQATRPPNIHQRIKYFNMALTYGKAAQGAAHAGRGLDVFYLKDQLDVAQLQESVFFQLEGRTHAMEQEDFSEASSAMRREWSEEVRARRQALKTLTWTLVDSSDLYNDYAFRFGLWESCIRIMQECDYRDIEELQTVYKNIIRECLARARVGVSEIPPMQDLVAPLHSCVLDLGSKFYVDGSRASFAFPHEYLIQGLEDLSTFYPSGAAGGWDAWVVRLMLEIGIAQSDLLDAYANYNKKINSNAQPIGLAFLSEGEENDQVWYSERSKLHVASAIVTLINKFGTQQDGRIFTDPRVRDLLENLAVVVGGLHSDDIQPEARSHVNHQISTLLSKVHNN